MQSSGTINEVDLSMPVNLYLAGRKLKDLDAFSKSDPVCRIYEKKQGQWIKIGETERISNNLNPNFEQAIEIQYYFEKKQDLKLEMIDDDGSGSPDMIGSIETTMGAIMGARN